MDYDHVKKQLGYGIQTESKDNAIKAIEQLTARVRELEEEQRIAELIAELEHIREQKNRLWFEFSIATQQLATLKTELREICAAIDDPACDLTLTTVECIKKLKAENESLKLDAERWRTLSALMFLGNVECTQDADGGYRIELDPAENMLGVSWEGNSPEEAIDAAMAKGEQ